MPGLCQIYNDAVDDPSKQDNFAANYAPVQVGITGRDSNDNPIFQEADDGDYYAIERRGSREHIVLPRLDLTLMETNYDAMEDVFDCPGYIDLAVYRHVKVDSPAYVNHDPAGEWRLTERGRLNLGEGE